MAYIPHTDADREAMLRTIGVATIDELFREIPEDLRLKGELNIPSALSEYELTRNLGGLARKNRGADDLVCFLGAGIYDRYIPSIVGSLISRGEFLTAYTPYQPEVSQGYLQTIYEFQSMVAELYGCDLANASMYDDATSLAEAALMAVNLKGRPRIAVSPTIHPHYLQVIETYCWAMEVEVIRLSDENGATSDFASDDVSCIVAQTPNFYGVLESMSDLRSACDRADAMMVVAADPIACALIQPPGAFGADIVVGEGQSLGIPMGYGGPLLGLFACRQELVRQIPGRIVGRTTDSQGRVGFTMTLRTREQDIRREKATSNICTNEALMALASTIYMSALGKNGLQAVAEATVRNTQYARHAMADSGLEVLHRDQKVFGEFVVDLGADAAAVRDELLKKGFLAGLPLGPYAPERSGQLLVSFTELRTCEEIDQFVAALKAAANGAGK